MPCHRPSFRLVAALLVVAVGGGWGAMGAYAACMGETVPPSHCTSERGPAPSCSVEGGNAAACLPAHANAVMTDRAEVLKGGSGSVSTSQRLFESTQRISTADLTLWRPVLHASRRHVRIRVWRE